MMCNPQPTLFDNTVSLGTELRLTAPQSRFTTMTVFSFYLFDRAGTCLVYKEWKRTVKAIDTDDDQKNMFGMLFALRNFSQKLSPNAQTGTPHFFVTDVYALHYFETATGLRFVLTTSRDFGGRDMVRHLREIYSDIYVEYAVKNPLYVQGTPITAPFFLQRLDSYVRSLPCF